jgi:uncharacterized membrane protein YciS (DUF1049 family)
MSQKLKGLILTVLILLLVVLSGTLGYFMVLNAQWVVVRYPMIPTSLNDPVPLLEYEAPLAAVMACAFGVGFLLSMLFFAPSWLKRAWERRQERRFINNLEGELSDLRNMPVTDPAPLEDIDEEPRGRQREREVSEEDEEAALLAAALQDRGEEAGR